MERTINEAGIYQPLKSSERQTRILNLRPGTGEDIVSVSLHVTTIPPQATVLDPSFERKSLDPIVKRLRILQQHLTAAQSNAESTWSRAERDQHIAEYKHLIALYTPFIASYEQRISEMQRVETERDQFDIWNHAMEALDSKSERLADDNTYSPSVDSRTDVLENPHCHNNWGESGHVPPHLSNLISRAEGGTANLQVSQGQSYKHPGQCLRQDHVPVLGSEDRPQSALEYQAISYCWGDSPATCPILVDGIVFHAPKSATEVLKNFRLEDRPINLWVDAISIDQVDLNERASQVAMMGDIHAHATQTRIWLGKDNDQTLCQLRICRSIAEQIAEKLGSDGTLDELDSIIDDLQLPDNDELGYLDSFFNRRWFTRVWVFQEVALSRRCVCYIGKSSIAWQDVMLTAYWCLRSNIIDNQHLSISSEDNIYLPSIIWTDRLEGYRFKYGGLTLFQLMLASRCLKASNPRDKIYGLLGMTRWSSSGRSLPKGIQPNYKISIRDCMRNATRVMIEEDENLEVLGGTLLHGIEKSEYENEPWPSWAILWCAEEPDGIAPLHEFYHASKALPLALGKSNDLDALLLDGYNVDTIECTSEPILDKMETLEDARNLFRALLNVTQHESSTSPDELLSFLLRNAVRMIDSLWMIRCSDRLLTNSSESLALLTLHQ